MNSLLKPLLLCSILFFVFMTYFTDNVTASIPTSSTESTNEEYDPVSKQALEYDVIIDIGHGGVDGGTFYGNILEKNLNLAIGSKLFSILEDRGYKVGVTRLQDYALSDDSSFEWIRKRHIRDLKQRWLIAQSLKPKVFISIHINYSANKGARGPIILHQRRAESFLLAELIQDELNQLTKTEKKAKATHRYYLLEKVTSPTLIAEVGFISHANERTKLQDEKYQLHIATKMANAIEKYFILYP